MLELCDLLAAKLSDVDIISLDVLSTRGLTDWQHSWQCLMGILRSETGLEYLESVQYVIAKKGLTQQTASCVVIGAIEDSPYYDQGLNEMLDSVQATQENSVAVDECIGAVAAVDPSAVGFTVVAHKDALQTACVQFTRFGQCRKGYVDNLSARLRDVISRACKPLLARSPATTELQSEAAAAQVILAEAIVAFPHDVGMNTLAVDIGAFLGGVNQELQTQSFSEAISEFEKAYDYLKVSKLAVALKGSKLTEEMLDGAENVFDLCMVELQPILRYPSEHWRSVWNTASSIAALLPKQKGILCKARTEAYEHSFALHRAIETFTAADTLQTADMYTEEMKTGFKASGELSIAIGVAKGACASLKKLDSGSTDAASMDAVLQRAGKLLSDLHDHRAQVARTAVGIAVEQFRPSALGGPDGQAWCPDLKIKAQQILTVAKKHLLALNVPTFMEYQTNLSTVAMLS